MPNSMQLPPLDIILTFDTDNDMFDYTLSFDSYEDLRARLQWKGVEEGIPQIRSVLRSVVDSHEKSACATWFVRADNQLRDLTGTAAYLLEQYAPLWKQLAVEGDELGMHPHLYRETSSGWVQETNPDRLRTNVQLALDAFQTSGWYPVVSRMGEAYCCNALLAELDALGFKADSTAMPGRIRKDDERLLDWKNTPQHPYHPSILDYRVPGKESLQILEIPMSMAHVKADYDRCPFPRYVDLSFHPRALGDGLRKMLPHTSLLVTITHPSAVLKGLNTKPHGLLSFDLNSFKTNLRTIVDECSATNRPFRFRTMSQLLSNHQHERDKENE